MILQAVVRPNILMESYSVIDLSEYLVFAHHQSRG